jgi:hypothetical protein
MTCGHQQHQLGGRWIPISPSWCPECHPQLAQRGRQVAEVTGYQGDILEDLHRAGVNVRKYRDATLSNFDPSEDPQALAAAKEYISAWRRSRGIAWLARDWMYLFGAGSARSGREVALGKLGNGKTFLAIAIARHLIEHCLLDAKRFLFRTAETILLESEATFRTHSDESEKNLLRSYEQPELLIIDEMGARDPSPHGVRIFDELTKRREAQGTIWTSNLSIPVLVAGGEYLRRIADRIAGECGDAGCYIVPFRGHSRRRERSTRVSAA